MEGNDFKYWAFISYSHADNHEPGRKWGDWLHSGLENYRTPPELVGKDNRTGDPVPERITPIFQDEKELPASADLGIEIEHALKASRNLIVICSPRSAKSVWVEQEVIQFKKLGRETRIFPLIIAGEPNASESGKPQFDKEEECFCEALRYEVDDSGEIDRTRRTEPLAADVRWNGKAARIDAKEMRDVLERAKLRIVAGILGVGFDDLVQRERHRQIEEAHRKARRNLLLAGIFGLLAIAAIGLGVRAFLNGQAADRQREIVAEREVEIRERLSYQSVENGWRSWEGGDKSGALLWFSEALKLAEVDGSDGQSGEVENSVHRRRLGQLLLDHSELETVTLYDGGFDVAVFDNEASRLVTVRVDREIQFWDTGKVQPLAPPGKIRGQISQVLFNANNDRLLIAGDGGGRLWDTSSGRPVSETVASARLGHFSSSGRRIALRDGQNRVRVYEAETGEAVTDWMVYPHTVKATWFREGDQFLEVVLRSGEILSVDCATGRVKEERWGPGIEIRFASVHVGSGRLFLWSADETGSMWDLENRVALGDPVGGLGWRNAFEWSKNGKFARGEFDGAGTLVWDGKTGEAVLGPLKGFSSSFSDSEKYFEWEEGSDRTNGRHLVSVWDLESGNPVLERLDFALDFGSRASFAPQRDELIVGNENAPTRRWDLTTGREKPVPGVDGLQARAWKESANGRILGILTGEGTLEIRDAEQPTRAPLEVTGEGEITDFALSKNGDLAAVYSEQPPFAGGSIRIVKTADGENRGLIRVDSPGDPDKAAIPSPHFTVGWEVEFEFSDDGSLLLINAQKPEENLAYAPRATWIWNIEDEAPVATLRLPEFGRPGTGTGIRSNYGARITSAIMGRDSRRVFTELEDGSVEVFDLEDGSALAQLKTASGDGEKQFLFPSGYVVRVAGEMAQVIDPVRNAFGAPIRESTEIRDAVLSDDGRLLALTHFEPAVRVWDTATGRPVTDLFEKEGVFINTLEFSPDGKTMFAVSRGPSNPPIAFMRLFDIEHNRPLTPSIYSEERIWQGTFDGSGGRIIISGNKKGARVFDASNGNLLIPPMFQDGGTHESRFSSDGSRIATGSERGELRIWDSATAAPVTPILKHDISEPITVRFDDDRDLLATSGAENGIVLWHTVNGQRISGEIRGANFVGFVSGDDKIVLLEKEQGTLRIRDISPVAGSVPFWSAWSQLRSGRKIGPSTVALPLDSSEAYAFWEFLREELQAE